MQHTKDIYKKYLIGDYTYGNPTIIDRWGGDLQIGKFCSIAENTVIMLGGNHRPDWITTYPFASFFDGFPDVKSGCPKKEKKTIIGNDVWLCRDVLILPGVSIGDGAVIGAGTVVSKDVEPYSIFVGNPGRVVKKRFSDDIIQKLLKIKWWEWGIEKIKKNIKLLCSNNIDVFVKNN